MRMASSEPRPRFLLLLPPAPSPPTLSALKAAFGDTISQVLKEVAAHSGILEIAFACDHLTGDKGRQPRASLYSETQTLLAAIYRLVCVVATRDDFDIETPDGVDVRILLVAWSLEEQQKHQRSRSDRQISTCTPVIDMSGLARSQRPWQFAFGVESEAGEAMVKAFVQAKGSADEVGRVQSGPVVKTMAGSTLDTEPTSGAARNDHGGGNRHEHVAVGGTFDHLHIGHKLLLTMTVFAVDESEDNSSARSATIGITGDQLLVNKKHASVLESWADRQKAVHDFLHSLVDFSAPSSQSQISCAERNDPGPNGKSVDYVYPSGLVIKCTEIQDPFGPTITEEAISALIISAETRSGGNAVNEKRKGKGWKGLDVFEVDVLDADDTDGGDGTAGVKDGFEGKISSTAIREKLAKKTASL